LRSHRSKLWIERQSEIGIAEAADRLRTTERAIKALIGVSALKTRHVKARNNVTLQMIDPDDLDRFKERHVTLSELRAALGKSAYTVNAIRRNFGIEPIFHRTEVHATFYLRNDFSPLQ
jgi:replication initiation and membrane attachment protein DnaB